MKLSLPSSTPRSEEPRALESVISYLRSVADELRRWSTNRVDMRNNVHCKFLEFEYIGPPNSEQTVTHNMGVKPFMYIENVDKDCDIIDSRRVDWTTTELFIKCSAANVNIRMLVLG